jgi:hypothetical protein
MPNWCATDFVVSGPAKDISRSRDAVRNSHNGEETAFDFDRLIPMPPGLSENFR